MPRYFFRLTDGKQLLDNHRGLEAPGDAAASDLAVGLARDLKHGETMAGWDWGPWSVLIVDDHDREVDEIPIADI